MNYRALSLLGILTTALSGAALDFPHPVGPRELRAGVASEEIALPSRWQQQLVANKTSPERIAQATAMVLQQGKRSVALVLCDLPAIPMGVLDQVQAMAAEKTGIAPTNILFASTGFSRGNKDVHAAPTMAGAVTEQVAELPKQMAEAIIRANAGLRLVRLEVGRASVSGVDLDRAPSEITAMMITLPRTRYVWQYWQKQKHAAGKPVASLAVLPTNWGTVGGTDDDVGLTYYYGQRLKELMGKEFVPILANGCVHADRLIAPAKASSTMSQDSERVGRFVAHAMVSGFPTFVTVNWPSLAVVGRRVQLPLSTDTSANVSGGVEIRLAGMEPEAALNYVSKRQQTNPLFMTVELQAIRLGAEAAIVCVPEGLPQPMIEQLRKESPFTYTLVLPTISQSAESTMPLVRTAVLRPDLQASEAIARQSVNLLQELRQGLPHEINLRPLRYLGVAAD